MGYLDSDGLKCFAQNVKNKAMWNWQWTKTAPCVHFWPGEETELEPVVDFLFKEIPPAEGEKGPDNPSTIQGISEVIVGRCGKNLLHRIDNSTNWCGLSIIYQEDGSYLINGTVTGENEHYLQLTDSNALLANNPSSIILDKNKKYTATVQIASGTITEVGNIHPQILIGRKYSDNSERYILLLRNLEQVSFTSVTNQANVLRDGKFIARLIVHPGEVYNNVKLFIQLEEGEEFTGFAPPLPISYVKTIYSLNNSYAKGKINLKTGELTITHNFVQLTTDHAYGWNGDVNSLVAHYNPNSKGRACSNEICSHFPFNEAWNSTTTHFYQGLNNTYMFNSSWTSKQDGLDFIAEQQNAGTPVTVVYELGEPQTIQLTPQQILSLPRLDHYVPRMNIVYTDQQSVKVGYKKIDNADSYSDEEISGTKTFATSPLVPDPDDLESQQIAPISFTKDMMRAEIEALTSGRNTIVRDQWGNPHVMVVMPKFMLSAIDPSWPNEPHPAFIVNGVEKSEVFIGKYLASKSSANRVQTLPGQLPWANITFDNALTACRSLGNGFGMNTNAIWAARALWLWKTMPSGHEYLGNSNYGRTYSNHMLTGTPPYAYCIPGDTSTSGRTLTGTGGVLWNDNEEVDGIADLYGNVYEWCSGLRLMNGEIQIIQNNDAILSTTDLGAESLSWKAILENGSLVAPNTTDTLKYDGTSPDTTESYVRAGHFRVNTTVVNPNINGYYSGSFKTIAVASGVSIPNILKALALYPVSSNAQGDAWACIKGERLSSRGGAYSSSNGIGPFNIAVEHGKQETRTYTATKGGFRIAYIP